MTSVFLLLLSFIVQSVIVSAIDTINNDLVSSLPGYNSENTPDFDTYSGYLSTISGNLFYMLTEASASNPESLPLVLWLNGGPGCSSLMGQFIELGPYHPFNSGANIEYNPYSWNNFANILYIESPVCVGFSFPYSRNCQTFTTNDNQTKYDNYYGLQSFFKKFEKYEGREFFITGESYAGHYIPQLSKLIIQENDKILMNTSTNNHNIFIHLSAIAIGNPYIDRDSNWFRGWLPTMFNMGIIGETQYQSLLTGKCSNHTLADDECKDTINTFINDELYDINVYDVNVHHNCSARSRQETELLRYIYQSSEYESALSTADIYAYPYTPCNELNLVSYLNRREVWDALHVNYDWMLNSLNEINNNSWQICSWFWNGYDINRTDDSYSQVSYFPWLLNNDIRILIYSGNNDLVCSYSGTRYWIYYLLTDESIKGKPLGNWTSWHINGEVGGWFQEFSNNFTFAVVRDAGHEVPEYQPERAYSLFQRFLAGNFSDEAVTVEHINWNKYKTTAVDGNSASIHSSGTSDFMTGIGVGSGTMLVIILFLSFMIYYLRWRSMRSKSDHLIKLEEDDEEFKIEFGL